MEALRHDHARLVENEDTGIGKVCVPRIGLDAVGRVVFLDPLVEEAEATHHVAAFVGEQGKGDGLLVREGPEHRHRVVAHGEERDPGGFDPGENLLQLDQLRLAERSPVRAAVEDDEGPPATSRGVQVHRDAMLIRQDDLREARALARADGREVSRRKRHLILLP